MTRTSANKRVEFSPIFERQLQEAPLLIKHAVREAVATFLDDPTDVSLRNHPLGKEHADKRSIDITDDWRALYREEAERIIFVEFRDAQEALQEVSITTASTQGADCSVGVHSLSPGEH